MGGFDNGRWLCKCVGISAAVLSVLITSAVLIAVSLKKLDSTQGNRLYLPLLDELLSFSWALQRVHRLVLRIAYALLPVLPNIEVTGVSGSKLVREKCCSTGEGLHAGPPFFEFLKYSAVFLSRELMIECVSKDGLVMPLTLSFQYLPDRDAIKNITELYRNSMDYDKIVVAAAKTAVHHGCGDFEIEEFQSRRLEVQETQKQYLTDILNGRRGQRGLMATVVDVQLQNVDPPDEWEAAVEAKENAREDIRLAQNERLQSLTKAQTRLKVATEEARIEEARANTTAQVTLSRAESEAQALLDKFEKIARQAKMAMDTLDLDTEGILKYLLNRQVESKNRVEIGLKQHISTPDGEL